MHRAKVLLTEFVTHDVKRFIIEKPEGYKFIPGQATDVAINKPGWENNKHPFTFTCLNSDLVLEFTIKGYPKAIHPNHTGMTEMLHTLNPGDEILLDDPWGTINFKGKGVFLAAGAGITPFIAIFRDLRKKHEVEGNSLIFSNKTTQDVILEKELRHTFGPNALTLVLTRESSPGYIQAHIDKNLLQERVHNFEQNFYLCGPKPFVADMKKILAELGAPTDTVVFEE